MPDKKINLQPAAVTAAYVHVPFCMKKCSYCDFVSYAGQPESRRQAYCQALLSEIRLTAAWARQQQQPVFSPLQTVFIGGGTPTVLTGSQLASILETLDQAFGLASDGEFTLEANPGTVAADALAACRQAGYNRISFGLQAYQPHLLRMLGRIHDPADFTASVENAYAAGFSSINADIMFGLPGQSLSDVEETVRFLFTLPVDHVSFYSLTLEEGTPLQVRCAADPSLLPDEETERAQYHLIRDLLRQNGFEHYEISNAARPGSRCRHNLVYWHGQSYYGFGAAAHSFVQGIRRANADDLQTYIEHYANIDPAPGAFAAAEILEEVDEAEAQKEMLLLGLRLLEGVRYDDFSARFGKSMSSVFGRAIRGLTDRGLLIDDGSCVRLSPAGLDLANQVFQEFV